MGTGTTAGAAAGRRRFARLRAFLGGVAFVGCGGDVNLSDARIVDACKIGEACGQVDDADRCIGDWTSRAKNAYACGAVLDRYLDCAAASSCSSSCAPEQAALDACERCEPTQLEVNGCSGRCGSLEAVCAGPISGPLACTCTLGPRASKHFSVPNCAELTPGVPRECG